MIEFPVDTHIESVLKRVVSECEKICKEEGVRFDMGDLRGGVTFSPDKNNPDSAESTCTFEVTLSHVSFKD